VSRAAIAIIIIIIIIIVIIIIDVGEWENGRMGEWVHCQLHGCISDVTPLSPRKSRK